jgi:CRISPR-associated protein Cmr4
MHVGSGEANYNIIDNEVQKDVVLQDVPAIHPSGVKGALREHFETLWGKNDGRITAIFGGGDDTSPGKYRFFGAKLIARPLRVSVGNKPYLLTTANDILEDFSTFLAGVGLGEFFHYDDNKKIGENEFLGTEELELEGLKVSTRGCPDLRKYLGESYAVANSLKDFSLPVMARNALDENGKSQNLWYEEVVPHKSIFYFVIMTPGDEKIALELHNATVQFGGNASIGQGFTRITQVFPQEEAAK